ncbi:hypothetical protein ACP70R_048681 [Stipagrostis hirtigluma subsp. patula]
MTPPWKKVLKLVPAVLLVASLLLWHLECSSSSCCDDHQRGGAAGMLVGRRLLLSRHGVALAKGLLMDEHGSKVFGEEEKREVITGPNPLHNR